MTATQTDAPLPTDAVMATLLALAAGREMVIDPEAGRMVVILPSGTPYEVDGDHLDDLVVRKWVTVDDDSLLVITTETGAYWLKRWLPKQKKKRARR